MWCHNLLYNYIVNHVMSICQFPLIFVAVPAAVAVVCFISHLMKNLPETMIEFSLDQYLNTPSISNITQMAWVSIVGRYWYRYFCVNSQFEMPLHVAVKMLNSLTFIHAWKTPCFFLSIFRMFFFQLVKCRKRNVFWFVWCPNVSRNCENVHATCNRRLVIFHAWLAKHNK